MFIIACNKYFFQFRKVLTVLVQDLTHSMKILGWQYTYHSIPASFDLLIERMNHNQANYLGF